MMHVSSPWLLGEEEGLFEDLISRSSGRRSDGCRPVVRSGSDGDLSFGNSKFFQNSNPKEGGEWMRRQIMRLLTPFIKGEREGRQCGGGETASDEWSSSMLLFRVEERKGQRLFRKGKGARGVTLDFHAERQLEGQPAVGVG
jgi:hypothetical protein